MKQPNLHAGYVSGVLLFVDKISKLFIIFFYLKVATLYTIIVRTGTSENPNSLFSMDGPGTDCNVKVKIHGKSKKTGLDDSTDAIKLKNSEHFNKFEKGQ